MCDICKKHGDGDKWYFNPKNYSKEMGEARKEFLEKIAGKHFEEWLIGGTETIEKLTRFPIIDKITINLMEKYEKRIHGGQIISLNDVLKTLELCENPSLLPCACRSSNDNEKYYCLNFGLIPELYKKANPDESIEELTPGKARRFLKKCNNMGLYHLILWYKLPYIGTICNCSNINCMAFKERQIIGTKNTLLKGEFVARIAPEKCSGCKSCLTRCQFGAIYFDVDEKRAFINIRKCFGCGLCETACRSNAIRLIDRKLTPARNIW